MLETKYTQNSNLRILFIATSAMSAATPPSPRTTRRISVVSGEEEPNLQPQQGGTVTTALTSVVSFFASTFRRVQSATSLNAGTKAGRKCTYEEWRAETTARIEKIVQPLSTPVEQVQQLLPHIKQLNGINELLSIERYPVVR